jgi:hypothetical protein
VKVVKINAKGFERIKKFLSEDEGAYFYHCVKTGSVVQVVVR